MNLKSALLFEIKKRREEKKLSQADIASMLNISPDAYRKIENGSNALSVMRLLIICQKLEFSLVKFFSENIEGQLNSELVEIENKWLKKEIEHLIQEVWYLRETNHKLLQVIDKNSLDFTGI
tara:strand:+ start:4959 stop:5324 length:366 start_codon:yes stop_codon:yes gene_type:complete